MKRWTLGAMLALSFWSAGIGRAEEPAKPEKK